MGDWSAVSVMLLDKFGFAKPLSEHACVLIRRFLMSLAIAIQVDEGGQGIGTSPELVRATSWIAAAIKGEGSQGSVRAEPPAVDSRWVVIVRKVEKSGKKPWHAWGVYAFYRVAGFAHLMLSGDNEFVTDDTPSGSFHITGVSISLSFLPPFGVLYETHNTRFYSR